MRWNRIHAAVVIVPLLGGYAAIAAAAAEPTAGDSLDLAALVREALAVNPDAAAARELWRAAEARVPAAGALDDPVLELMLDEQPVRGDGSGSREVSLSQMVPFPGKRGLMTAEARRMAEAEREMARDMARAVVTEVKEAYWRLYMLESQLATMRDSRLALEDAIDATRARYEAGIAGQQDLLLAKVEAGELDAAIRTAEEQAKAARAQLNLAIGRDASTPLGRPGSPALSPFAATREDVVAAARSDRPSVRAKEREVASAEAAHRLARIAYRPDFMLSAGYMDMPDEIDQWRAAVALTLPVWKWRKQNAEARAAGRRAVAAREALDAEKNRVEAAVEERFARVTAERDVVALYEREILPAADLAYRSARANYLAGKETFLVLLEAVRKNLDLRKMYYEFFADTEMQLARLEEAAGTDLGGIRLDPDLGLSGETKGR